jgi:hypothetical protein
MRTTLSRLENRLKYSTGRNAALRGKLARQIAEQKSAIEAAKAAWELERPAVGAANDFLRAASKLQVTSASARGKALRVLGEAAVRLERALEATRAGRVAIGLGRVASNPAVAHGLLVIGGVVGAIEGYRDSPATTKAGKVVNGVLAGGGDALVMAHPGVAIADMVVPRGYKPSQHFRGTSTGVSTLGEAAVLSITEGPESVSTRGMEAFHERSKAGEYGKVMQLSSEAGDYWADEGIIGGLSDFGREFVDWLF